MTFVRGYPVNVAFYVDNYLTDFGLLFGIPV